MQFCILGRMLGESGMGKNNDIYSVKSYAVPAKEGQRECFNNMKERITSLPKNLGHLGFL